MIDFLPFAALRSSAKADGGNAAAEDPEGLWGLEELLAIAGAQLGEEITPRTVRLYATQGLIDRPGREGRSAVYGRRHLLQLLLIRSLARRGLSLAAIAPLCGLADDELAQQLAQLEGSSEAALPTSQPLSSAEGSTQPAASQEAPANEALAFLQQLRQDSGTHGAPSPARAAARLIDPADDPAQDGASQDSRSLLSLLGSPLSSRSSPSSRSSSRSGGSREAASRWHRFTLAPGVELQISEAVSIPPPGSRRTAWLNRLVARLIEQIEDSPP